MTFKIAIQSLLHRFSIILRSLASIMVRTPSTNLNLGRPAHMRDLYRICRAQKYWKGLPNGMHNDTVIQPGYFGYIADFITQVVLNPLNKR